MRKRSKSIILPLRNEKAIKKDFERVKKDLSTKRKKTEYEKKVDKTRKRIITEHHAHVKSTEPKKKKINWKKIIIWATIIIAALVIIKLINIKEIALDLIKKNPSLWHIYKAIAKEVEAKTLKGLLYASFFGSLFFISLPVEVIFIYYLGLNYYFIQIIIMVLLGNIAGMIINYGFGWLLEEIIGLFLKIKNKEKYKKGDAIRLFMKKNYDKFKKKIDRAGALIVLIGNIIPFPIEPFAVFLGAVRYNFKKYIAYTIIGKLIKFLLLWIGYTYFMKFAGPFLNKISVDWFVASIKNIFMFWKT